MTHMTTVKLLLAAAGIAIWLFGQHTMNDRLRWLGIGMLVVALLLRFVGRSRGRSDS